VTALRVPSGQFLNVNMACDLKPFDDGRVREALALTVDREAMVGFVAEGYGTPGNDTPLSPAYHFYQQMPLRPRDIAGAKRLLAEAGYPNGLDVTLVASDTPGTRTQLGVAMREMAKDAGFRIQVQTMPHADVMNKVDEAGKTFRILFIKTTSTIPYTSVFMRLDCGYLSDEGERKIRAAIAAAGSPQPK